MAWLANLDARATRWPPLARAAFLLTKWLLIGLGGFMVVRLWLDRIGLWSLY